MSEQTLAKRNEQSSSQNVEKLSSLDTLDIIRDKDVLKDYFTTLLRSGKAGFKTVDEAFAVLERSRELNLPFLSATEHIHVVNGKTGLDVHLIKALLSRAGTITWKKTKDYVPLYKYTDGNQPYDITACDENVVVVRDKVDADKLDVGKIGIWICKYYKPWGGDAIPEYMLTDSHKVVVSAAEKEAAIAEGKVPLIRIESPILDYYTEYEFTRKRMINGKEVEQKCISRFSFNDAVIAELTGNATYKKYPKTMVGIRAFTLGAREIASDKIQGCYETSELYHMNNKQAPIQIVDVEDATIVE